MDQNDAEREILERQDQWMDAARRKDVGALESILGEEYVLISARLGFVDRRSWLDAIPSYNIREFEYVDSEISVYVDTAVSNSRYRQEADFGGQDLSSPFYVTDVWVHRDGRWQVVSRHTSIPTEGSWASWEGKQT